MKRILTLLSVASVMALGCTSPTAPVSAGKLSVPLLDCGSNTNNSNNPPATASGGCSTTNNNNNNNNNLPTTAKQP